MPRKKRFNSASVNVAPAQDIRSAAFVHVDRMDVADARMVVLVVVPGEEAGEVVAHGLRVDGREELVGRRGLEGAEKGFDKGVVEEICRARSAVECGNPPTADCRFRESATAGQSTQT